ncbi:MAG TPA: butyrate kinase [Bacteroidales bacterium]|nr:butyrate kinase [Bacteroidales bacterium]
MGRLILAINPGSTSTKFSLYEEDKLVFENTLRHTAEDLKGYEKITDQFHFRKDLIMQELTERKIDFKRIRAVVGRGGLLQPVESGVYEVNSRMIQDLATGRFGQHASNLGGLIAHDLKMFLQESAAFIVDPVVVDELQDVARISGHPEIERRSIFHALNQKAVARIYAGSINRKYDDLNLIVAHMGGGISVGAHSKGKVIDVNNAFNGEGPMSPERSGGLPSGQLADLCFSGKFTHDEVKSMITGKGGMVAYLGTNNFVEVAGLAEKGNKNAHLIKNAISYQIGKEIGSAAAVLHGNVDAIILTGGLAHDPENISILRRMTGFISKVVVYPGEDEMKSLAFNGLLALDKKVRIKQYI